MSRADFSGRPLSAKLDLKPGMICWRYNMPRTIEQLLDKQEPGLNLVSKPTSGLTCAHLFVTERHDLNERLEAVHKSLAPDGMIWVSWPKKASKVPTSVTEDVIRELCLPKGLVDVKVCTVDDVWSGLKLVIRKELRKDQAARLKGETS